MPKISSSDLTDLGFTSAMFGKDDTAFGTMATGLIAEQAAILEGRIGSTLYAKTEEPEASLIKRAEKGLAAAEMLQRRLNILAQEVQNADGKDATKLRKTRSEYLQEAENLIQRLADGSASASVGYSGGVIISSHFAEEESPFV